MLRYLEYDDQALASRELHRPEAGDDYNFDKGLVWYLVGTVLILSMLTICCIIHDGYTSQELFNQRIMKKRVLPHDQSHIFCNETRDENDEEKSPHSVRFYVVFCSRRLIKNIANDPETEDVEGNHQLRHNSICMICDVMNKIITHENRVRPSEDSTQHDTAVLCPICIEPFKVGEEIVVSKYGYYCRHGFHNDCILQWVTLGHTECPVCKEDFCSARDDDPTTDDLRLETRRSKFCIECGMVSPTNV